MKIQFKTNINCNGCVRLVSPYLNQLDFINKWEVNTDSNDKVLTVELLNKTSGNDVINVVKDAGFEIEEYIYVK